MNFKLCLLLLTAQTSLCVGISEESAEITPAIDDFTDETVNSAIFRYNIELQTTVPTKEEETEVIGDKSTTIATTTDSTTQDFTTTMETTTTAVTTRIVPARDEPPCEDTVNNRTGRSDCPLSKHLCTRRRYVEFMKKTCPQTCGYCNQTRRAETNCDDGFIGCPRYERFCNNTRSGEFIRTHCRKTCGLCGNSTTTVTSTSNQRNLRAPECRDAARTVFNGRRCCQMLTRCGEPSMKTDCAASCGYCIAMTEQQCRDLSLTCRKENCTRGTASFRTYMKEICPVTCGFCDQTTGKFF